MRFRNGTLAFILCLTSSAANADELAVQGRVFSQTYHQGGFAGAPGTISGLGVHLRYVTPGSGTFTIHAEGYGQSSRGNLGGSYVQWELPQWRGRQWRLTAGDFELSTSLLERPFYNVFSPNITATGARVEAFGRNTFYQAFAGRSLLYLGPRISLRTTVPQNVSGGGVRLSPARFLQLGFSTLHLSNDLPALNGTPFERNTLGLSSTTNATGQALFAPRESLKFFGEATVGRPRTADGSAGKTTLGYIAGVTYLTPRVTARVNYVDQARTEMPLLQTRAGDRKGPFAEFSIRPSSKLEFFTSGSSYQSHSVTEGVNSLRATSLSGGVHIQLPGRFDLTASVTEIRAFSSVAITRNRQVTTVLSRPWRRATIRLSARELQLRDATLPTRQRSWELEATNIWQRMVAGGAVRLQQSNYGSRRTTVYGRENLQLQLQKFTFFQNFEYGRDLANDTLFATNSFQTTSAGVAWRPNRNWSIDAEVFRNRLSTYLNPLQEFILGGAGMGGNPLLLSGFNQWTFFLRVTRSFQMGPPLAPSLIARPSASGNVVLTGVIEGLVREWPGDLTSAALSGIAVQLDEDRLEYTDHHGRFRFSAVTDGPHSVRLSPRELPAEYDPAAERADLVVRPGRTARMDLLVHPLGSLVGSLLTEAGLPVGGVYIRVQPSGRSTVTGDDGLFQIHNLRAGSYEVSVDEHTLPPRHVLLDPSARRPVSPPRESEPVHFRVRVNPEPPKPIRVIFQGK